MHWAIHKASNGQLFWQSGIIDLSGGQQSMSSIMAGESTGIPPRAATGATTSEMIPRIISNREICGNPTIP
jgi:hypothetical protein